MSEVPPQVFVRNESGRVWGPLALGTVELLIDNAVITGRILVSEDGLNFAYPGRFPHLRDAFPRELWGDGAPAANASAAASAPVAAAPRAAAPAAAAPRAAAPSPVNVTPPAPAATAVNGVPASGNLAATSPIRLYFLAAVGQHTGRLSLKLADRTLTVHFRKGNPEFVESTHREDALETFLIEQQLVTKDALERAIAAGGELLAALFAQGAIHPGTAFTHLVRRSTGLLLKLLSAEAGTFTFDSTELPAQKAMPLGQRWGVLTDTLRKISAPDLKRRLAPVFDRPMMKSTGAIELHDLRLTPQETRALGGIDGVRSLEQLCRETPQEAETYLRLAFLLRHLDLVSFAQPAAPRVEPKSAPPPAAAKAPTPPPRTATPAQSRPAAPPPAGAPTGAPAWMTNAAATARPTPAPIPGVTSRPTPAPIPVVTQVAPSTPTPAQRTTPPPSKTPPPAPPAQVNGDAELQAKLAELKTQTHFERLGVADNADASAVKMAYFKLARVFHPDTATGAAGPEIVKLKADIFGLIGEAYRVLSDDAARAKYVDELKHGAGDFDVQSLLQAEELFHRACVQIRGKRFAEGVKLLDEAISLNSEEGEFYAWRGYARFFTIADKKVAFNEASKDLQLATKKNDKCAIAWFYLGQLAKLCGDSTGSLKHFKRTLELQPNHIDAQREVRLLTKK